MPDFAIITRCRVSELKLSEFSDWQASLHHLLSAQPGFLSLEIVKPLDEWMITQRFSTQEELQSWKDSRERSTLIAELRPLVLGSIADAEMLYGGVTEVFVTEVKPEKQALFKEWIAKIHHQEAKFPGFRGVYLQAPQSNNQRFWITLLQFDKSEHLDAWLASKERKDILEESKEIIHTLETHRMVSPYAAWFSSIAKGGLAEIPPLWKQTMVVLLLLFPIVMLEFKYLMPLFSGLNGSLATFIGNAVSVTLIAWPLMQIACLFLAWWLSPNGNKKTKSILGATIVVFLYILEIALFY